MATSDLKVYRPPADGQAPDDYAGGPAEWRDPNYGTAWVGTRVPVWHHELEYRYRPGSADRPNSLPEDPDLRNSYPMADGLLDYFPNALAEVSRVSHYGNQQHNPGQPMHWARGKSTDHRNKILRHLIDAGGKDNKGIRHSAYLAWRALANLQQELEDQEGVPMSRGSRAAK